MCVTYKHKKAELENTADVEACYCSVLIAGSCLYAAGGR